MLRAAFVHLGIGATVGALMLAGKVVRSLAGALALLPAHEELLLVGWLVQLVVGAGFWILPRLPDRPREADTGPAALVLLLLNGGVLAACAGELALTGWLTAAGRAAELVAVLEFLRITWPRVRRYGLAA
jgi:hypothetical protein